MKRAGEADRSAPPDTHPGRSRARLSLLLPALALLLGALFHAAPAAAQSLTAPTNMQITAGDASLTLTWTAPSYTVDTASVRWRVKDTNPNTAGNQAGSWIPPTGVQVEAAQRNNRSVPLPPWACTGCIAPTNGVTYEVQAQFTRSSSDGGGNTGWVSAGEGTPVATQQTTLAAPTGLTVSSNDGSLELEWSASTGATGYDVHYTSAPASGNGAVTNSAAVQTGTSPSAASGWVTNPATNRQTLTQRVLDSISGLSNGTTYRVRVRAKASSTTSVWVLGSGTPVLILQWVEATSSAVENATAENLYLSENAISAAVSGTLTYAAGNNNPASLADDLTSGYATTFTATASQRVSINSPLAVDDAVNEEDETYTITINAGTGYTVGTRSTLTVTILDNDPPEAPSGLSLTAGNAKLTASWTKPAGPVAGYQLRYKETSATNQAASTPGDPSTGWVTSTPAGTGTSAEITGLTNATAYHVQVRADDGQTSEGRDSDRYSDWSASQTGTPAVPTVAAPTNLSVSAGDAQLSLTWTAPTATLTGYDVHYTSAVAGTVGNDAAASGSDPSAAWVAVTRSGTTASQTISSLSNGTLYRVRVRAKTSSANSAWRFGSGTPVAPVSSDADLSGLTATSSTSASGTFSALTLSPSPFAAATTDYTASVANARTHVKLAPTVNHSNATVEVGKGSSLTAVTSGSASGAIALVVGANAITVKVTAEDGSTMKTYTVTVTRAAAQQTVAAPTNLVVSPGNAQLGLTWTAPTGTLTGYDVHYTSADAGTVGNNVAASGNNAATAWVAVTRSGTTASQTISSLANGTPYRVRVRAKTSNADGAWAFGTGTPQGLPTVSLSATPNPVPEGQPVTVTATLSRALSNSVTLPVTVTSGTAESGDHGTLASITVATGATTGTGAVSTNQDADEDHETFTVALGTLPSSVTAGSPSSVTVTISDDDASAPVTPRPTAPETAERSFRENVGDAPTAEARDIGAPVAAPGLTAPVQYLLEGEDREAFTIGADNGQLRTRTGTVYDYEQRPGYAVVVRARAGTASVTTAVTVTVLDVPEPPLAPKVPQVRPDADDDTGLTVAWAAPGNAGRPAITGYAVRYRQAGGAWEAGAVDPGELRTRLTGLAPGTRYQVQVRAVNADGDGPWSDSGEGRTAGDASASLVEGWLVRFGRTVSDQVLEAAGDRFTAARPGLTARLAGRDLQALRAGRETLDAASEGIPQAGAQRHLTWRDALGGAAFSYTAETGAGGRASFWGRGAVTRFDGEERDLRLDGEALTGLLGVDLARGPLRAGLILSHSDGDGEYRSPTGRGRIDSDLTGLYPWVHRALDERLSVWGLAGLGAGEIRLKPDGGPTIQADTDLKMASAGVRGVLRAGAAGAGPELALVSDGLYLRTESDAVGDRLAGTSAELTRLRLGLEGRWHVALASGAHLNPSLALGLRHDGGDAETGFGADLAAGLAWSDPPRGLTASVRARGLLTHEDSGFRERGLSAALAWDPHPASATGWSMTLEQTLGAVETGGLEALLRPESASHLAADDERGPAPRRRRLEATLGYGVLLARGRLVGTPHAALALSDTAREIRLGWRLDLVRRKAVDFGLELHGARQETLDDDRPPAYLLRLQLGAHW